MSESTTHLEPRQRQTPGHTEWIDYDRFVDARINQTVGQVKLVDLLGSLMTLVIGTLAFFVLAAVADAWIISGGMGFTGRLIAFLAYCGWAGFYVFTHLGPLVLRKINPVYAAHAIEEAEPTIKNGLLNLLFLRGRDNAVSRETYEVVQRQAALGLQHVHAESVVDRSGLIKLALVLLCLVVVAVAYALWSPKNPLSTVWRIAAPWADIPPPSRVKIHSIQPGNTTAYHGDQLIVGAKIDGVREHDEVVLTYTTEDRQRVDREVIMRPVEAGLYQCSVPEGELGLRQSLSYRVMAGDATSVTYHVDVVKLPTISVERVDYEFPAYTGWSPTTEEGAGDIKAIEGTRITVHAIANQPMKAATVHFDGMHGGEMSFDVDGDKAVARFPLELPEGRSGESYRDEYELRFTNMLGQDNPRPIKHQIEITPDFLPTIEFLEPERSDFELPANASLQMRFRANDDFALGRVAIAVRRDEKVQEQALLTDPWQGQFVGQYILSPLKLGLAAGDEITVAATAVDNKEPNPNHSRTKRELRIQIVEPVEGEDGMSESSEEQSQEGPTSDNAQSPEEEPADADKTDPHGEGTNDAGGQERTSASETESGGEQTQANDQGAETTDQETAPENNGSQEQGETPSGEFGDEHKGSQQGTNSGESSSGRPQSQEGQQDGEQNPDGGKTSDNNGKGKGASRPDTDRSTERREKPVDNDGEAFEIIRDHLEQSDSNDSQQATSTETSDEPNQQRADGTETTGHEANKTPEPMAGESTSQNGESTSTQSSEDQRRNESSGTDARESDGQTTDEVAEQPRESNLERESDSGGPSQDSASEKRDVDQQAAPESQGRPTPSIQSDDKPSDEPTRQGTDLSDNSRQNSGKPTQNGKGMDNRDPEPPGPAPSGGPDAEKTIEESEHQSATTTENKGQKGDGDASRRPQSSDQPGTGGTGKNTPSDDGTGQANDQGDGESTGRPGSQAEATEESPRGTPGDERGQGSETSPSDRKDGQGQDIKDSTDSSGAEQAPSDSDASNDSKNPESNNSGSGGGPGDGGDGPVSPRSPSSTPTGAMDPNLEYADRATDFVLDRLDQQMEKNEPDKGLLDKLGWSADQLKSFASRWRQLKDEARKEPAENAGPQRRLNRALDSLGLQPKGSEIEGGARSKDDMRALEEGIRIEPPAAYRDAFRAFKQGISRSREPADTP